VELYQAAVRSGGEVYFTRRNDIHRAGSVRDGRVAVDEQHIQVVVPDVRGAGIPADNERMVSAHIYEYGRRIPGESAVAVIIYHLDLTYYL